MVKSLPLTGACGPISAAQAEAGGGWRAVVRVTSVVNIRGIRCENEKTKPFTQGSVLSILLRPMYRPN